MGYDFDAPIRRAGTNCEKWDGTEQVFGKKGLLPFWVADMDFRSAPEIIEALRACVDFGVFGYPTMPDSARKAVADWQATRHGWKVDPATVQFVPGIVTGLTLALNEFTAPGDGVVIQTPVYHPFFGLIRENGREIVENPLRETPERYEMDFDNLRAIITPKVKALLLCSPHNPVARVWSREELTTLAEICRERNVTIFCDEIHQDLVYSDAKHTPLGSVAPGLEDLLLTFVAPSKTFNIAGLAASAWIPGGPKVARTMQRAMDKLHLEGINLMAIAALEAAYTKGAPWLEALLPYLENNRSLVERCLKERLPKVRLKHPEGTFIFWMDFRNYGLPQKELQRILVEEAGVALNSGAAFGAQGEHFVRFNIGCPKAQLEEGLNRIAIAFENR